MCMKVKKSRFVVTVWPVTSGRQALQLIKAASDLGATHNCWGACIPNRMLCFALMLPAWWTCQYKSGHIFCGKLKVHAQTRLCRLPDAEYVGCTCAHIWYLAHGPCVHERAGKHTSQPSTTRHLHASMLSRVTLLLPPASPGRAVPKHSISPRINRSQYRTYVLLVLQHTAWVLSTGALMMGNQAVQQDAPSYRYAAACSLQFVTP